MIKITALAVAFLLAQTSISYANDSFKECSTRGAPNPRTDDGVTVKSGFDLYASLLCSQSPRTDVNQYISDFGLKEKYWNDGMGWYDKCDGMLPFGRVASAIKFISFANDWNVYPVDGGTYYGKSKSWIDEISPQCGWNASASRDWFENVTFYMKGLYGSTGNSVGELAAMVVHEAWHENGSHNGKRCGSCDKAIYDSPVIKDELMFIFGTYVHGINHIFPSCSGRFLPGTTDLDPSCKNNYRMSEPQFEVLRSKANLKLDRRFDVEPKMILQRVNRIEPFILTGD